jgi:hypothetical protein
MKSDIDCEIYRESYGKIKSYINYFKIKMLTKNVRSAKSALGLMRVSQAAFHSSAPLNEVVSYIS